MNAAEADRNRSVVIPEKLTAHPLGGLLWARRVSEASRVELAPPVFSHGDFWPGNTVWRQQRLVGIVDFEQAVLADPGRDLAYCATDMQYVELYGAADRLIEVYKAETGRALESLDYWTMRALERPLPDIAVWIPSFNAVGHRSAVTAEGLRAQHSSLIRRYLD
jgi:Ser/Thr protein kinase RdoA (MazF antagonist)